MRVLPRKESATLFDELVIKNGLLVDGTGTPAFNADIRVKNGRIVEIRPGAFTTGSSVIDAHGLVVAPGFIDAHSHDDWGVLYDPVNRHSLQQGVTTVICGQCGSTPFPVTDKAKTHLQASLLGDETARPQILWSSFGEYVEFLQKRGIGTNFAFLVGHGSIRMGAMGMDKRKPSPQESLMMKTLVARCMEEGALGLSTGLIYLSCTQFPWTRN